MDSCSSSLQAKRAVVVAFGDLFQGDRGLGLCVAEALGQENLGSAVQLDYMGTEYGRLSGLLMGATLGMVLHWLPEGVIHGGVHSLDMREFLDFLAADQERATALAPLARVVQGMILAEMQPARLIFVLAPAWCMGPQCGVMPEERHAARKVVGLVKERLRAEGFCPGAARSLPRVYGFSWLKTAM